MVFGGCFQAPLMGLAPNRQPERPTCVWRCLIMDNPVKTSINCAVVEKFSGLISQYQTLTQAWPEALALKPQALSTLILLVALVELVELSRPRLHYLAGYTDLFY